MRRTTRSIPPALAPFLERLELERPGAITTVELAALGDQAGIATPINVAIQRLAQRGWLLPTGVRGVWEFAPAERAGPYSEGDPLLRLRAALAVTAGLNAAVALGSAMWLRNLADRAPDTPEVALPMRAHIPAALARGYRIVRFDAQLPVGAVRGIPVHAPATVLVHMAHRPRDVRSWAAMLEGLHGLVEASSEEEIAIELQNRPHATHARLAYLLSGVAPSLVERLAIKPAGRVWFGPRTAVRRYDARWNIADTVLPFSPAEVVRTADPR